MARWDTADVPHKGWKLIGYEDVLADPEGEYETCEMCHNERIRYVHIMEHPQFRGTLRVGCVCAEKMTGDYITHKEHEKELRNRATRRDTFLKRQWYPDFKGHRILDYRGYHFLAMNKENGVWGVVLNGEWVWKYQGRWILDFDTLKIAAFDLYEKANHRIASDYSEMR